MSNLFVDTYVNKVQLYFADALCMTTL